MKINQYCSACKQHLDMDVIPTDDAGDDGVIWLRCPQCHGFLPKFSGQGGVADASSVAGASGDESKAAEKRKASTGHVRSSEEEPIADGDLELAGSAMSGTVNGLPIESSSHHRVDSTHQDVMVDSVEAIVTDTAQGDEDRAETNLPSDSVAEFADTLSAADLSLARPYRATETSDVGDVIHHLAYGDVGIVVAKETLPGGRQAVKVFFEEAGVVHLIEQAPPDGR